MPEDKGFCSLAHPWAQWKHNYTTPASSCSAPVTDREISAVKFVGRGSQESKVRGQEASRR